MYCTWKAVSKQCVVYLCNGYVLYKCSLMQKHKLTVKEAKREISEMFTHKDINFL